MAGMTASAWASAPSLLAAWAIAQRLTSGPCGSQGGLGSGRDDGALLLGEGGIQVQQERLDVGAQLGDEERRLVRHQAADEMHVTRQPIELGNGDGGGLSVTASCSERGGELWPAIESVSALPRLDLGELRDDLEPLGLGEPGDGGALGPPGYSSRGALSVSERRATRSP
jgi:hypothetical protein